jgi:hypothetical protein
MLIVPNTRLPVSKAWMPWNRLNGFGGGTINARFDKETGTLNETALSGLAEKRRSNGRLRNI